MSILNESHINPAFPKTNVSSLESALRRFLYNIELVCSDIRLQEINQSVALYFDTPVVRAAILGMYNYLDPGLHPVGKDFSPKAGSDQLLVVCLAACGWLGPFRMLPPHQLELKRAIERGFGIPDQIAERNPAAFAHQFVLRVIEENGIDLSAITISVNPAAADVSSLLLKEASEYVQHAPSMFKLLQCITGSWRSRLMRFRSRGLLWLDPADEVNTEALFQREEFMTLQRELDRLRPLHSRNNIADALALALLITKVEEYQSGKKTEVPCFFVPTNSALRTALKTTSIDKQLEYAVKFAEHDHPRVTILRDEEYFAYRATFCPPALLPNQNDPAFSPDVFPQPDLFKIRKLILGLLQQGEGLSDNEIDRSVIINGKPFSEFLLQDLQGLSFVNSVWIPFCMDHDVREAVEELKKAQDPDLQQIAGAATPQDSHLIKDGIEKLWTETGRSLSLMLDLWHVLNRQPKKDIMRSLPMDFSDDLEDYTTQDTLRLFRLGAYGFPEKVQVELSRILKHFVSGDLQQIHEATMNIIHYLSAAVLSMTTDSTALTIVTALLIAMGKRSQALRLIKDLDLDAIDGTVPCHFSLRLLFVRTLEKEGRASHSVDDFNRLDMWCNTLMAQYEDQHVLSEENSPNLRERSDFALGLALILFSRWRARHGSRRNHDHMELTDLDSAIAYAEKALQIREEFAGVKTQEDLSRITAARNNVIFYKVHRAHYIFNHKIEPVEEAAAAYRSLQGLINTHLTDIDIPGQWIMSYTETIAEYDFLGAKVESKPKSRQNKLENAQYLIKRVLESYPEDKPAILLKREIDSYQI